MDLRYFVDAGGDSPFEAWFSALDSMAAAQSEWSVRDGGDEEL